MFIKKPTMVSIAMKYFTSFEESSKDKFYWVSPFHIGEYNSVLFFARWYDKKYGRKVKKVGKKK